MLADSVGGLIIFPESDIPLRCFFFSHLLLSFLFFFPAGGAASSAREAANAKRTPPQRESMVLSEKAFSDRGRAKWYHLQKTPLGQLARLAYLLSRKMQIFPGNFSEMELENGSA